MRQVKKSPATSGDKMNPYDKRINRVKRLKRRNATAEIERERIKFIQEHKELTIRTIKNADPGFNVYPEWVEGVERDAQRIWDTYILG